ncbi:MAG: hypothetical protein ACXWKX_05705 [Caulobacteraceae bacterium]
MTDAPDTPAPNAPPTDSDETDWSRPFVMRQLQLLGDLAEIGLEVARGVERRVKAAEADEDLAPVALAYSRVSRAVRLTLMLQSRLIKDRKADEQAEAKALAEVRAEQAKQEAVRDPVYQRKVRVETILERVALARHPGDAARADRLVREGGERLDDEDLYGDLMERPLSELVARLCRDLGLDPDWSELAEELWAVREVESGAVGWPLAGLVPPRQAGRPPPTPARALCASDTG